jgi:hypothetical protein
MKSPAGVLNVLAIFFIVLGVVWFSAIRVRCAEINPRPVLKAATLISSSQAEVAIQPKKVRSPHAKFYHDFLFWTVSVIEVFASVFYVLAGIFVLRRFVLARFAATLALGFHIVLMILVLGFMKFGTIPLSDLTHNPNLLQLYFLPSHKIHNIFSVFLTGFRFYLPGVSFYLIGVVLYFYLCYFVFSRPEVKSYLTPAGKA